MPFDPGPSLQAFQHLLDRIAADQDLTPKRRSELASAIRSFLKHTGGDATAPCDRQAVRTRIERGPRAGTVIAPKTWSNPCAEIRGILHRYDARSLQGKRRPLSPEWNKVWAGLTATPRFFPLSRLVHWASLVGMEPHQISDDTLAAFRVWLDERLVKKPEAVFQTTCRTWNRAVDEIPGWPQSRVTVPQRRKVLSLPLSEFPEPFRVDLARYAALASGQDLIAETTRSQPIRPETLGSHLRRLRFFASVQVHTGRPIKDITTFAASSKRRISRMRCNGSTTRTNAKPAEAGPN